MTQNKAAQVSITVALMALLGACAAQTQATLSDGTVAYRIDCDGTTAGLNYCFEKAGKSCGADGYTIVDRNGRTISTSRAADADADSAVRKYEADKNSIFIKCGT